MAIKKSEDVQPGDLIHPPLSPVWVEVTNVHVSNGWTYIDIVETHTRTVTVTKGTPVSVKEA